MINWKAIQITDIWRYVPPAYLPQQIVPSDGKIKRVWISMSEAIQRFMWPRRADCHYGAGQESQPFASYQEAEAYAHQHFGAVFGKDYFIKSVSA